MSHVVLGMIDVASISVQLCSESHVCFSRANGVRVFCLTIYEYSFLNIIYWTSFPYVNTTPAFTM